MGKADRTRQQSARERIAAQQAAARRAQRRRALAVAGGSVGLVVVIVAVLVVFALNRTSGRQSGSARLPASTVRALTSVPASVLAAVGPGSVLSYNPRPLRAVSDQPLTSGGKPEMLYIGAEFCPYCAAMRWSMAVALSRFGRFGPLTGIHSSATDYAPNTPTLTFYRVRYASRHLAFTPVENESITHAALQPLTGPQQAIWLKYTSGSYPFIDIGGRYVATAPMFDPKILAGLTWSQVAADLHDPASPVARAALGAANYLTAAICSVTGGSPAAVCQAAPIPALRRGL